MRYVVLNGEDYATKKDFYEDVRDKLEFPDYFGNNLDALSDCLSEVEEETTLLLLGHAAFEENLGDYVKKIERVLTVSAEENPHLSVRWMKD